MESFVRDLKQEPYVDVKELPFVEEFVVDVDHAIAGATSGSESDGEVIDVFAQERHDSVFQRAKSLLMGKRAAAQAAKQASLASNGGAGAAAGTAETSLNAGPGSPVIGSRTPVLSVAGTHGGSSTTDEVAVAPNGTAARHASANGAKSSGHVEIDLDALPIGASGVSADAPASTGFEAVPKGAPSTTTSDPSWFNPQQADGPVVLAWKNLSAFAQNGHKQVLFNLEGRVTTGFYAIMGPSGSGKTTLLNTLACRLDHNMRARGDVRLNGQPYTNTELKWMSAYVMQDDLLNGHLTVEETLRFSAELRMPKGTSQEKITERVEAVMHDMGITHVREVIVGTPLKKGISGGERKRLCVAMELLTQPLLLFLDEPTSGLDSVAALALCTKLKQLTDAGVCTVVCTIHQPQAKIFRLFDHLILMSRGHMIYQGLASKASHYFCLSGFPLPEHENPADHFMDVIGSTQSKMPEAPKLEVDLSAGIDRPRFLPRDATPWHKQFLILFRRSMKEQWRNREITYVLLIQSIIMGVLIGTVFLQIGTNQESISRRTPLLFFCCINQGIVGALITINSFPSERVLVLRERAAGTYYVSAYFLAKTTAESITSVVAPIVFSVCVYFLVGLQYVGSKFIIFTIFMILCALSATSLALAVSTWCRTTDLSVALLPLMMEIMRLFGGFFLPPAKLPNYFSWLDALSYVKYTYIGISHNELGGLEYYCETKEFVTGPNNTKVCPVLRGEETAARFGFDVLTLGECIGILISIIFILRLISYLGLRFIKS